MENVYLTTAKSLEQVTRINDLNQLFMAVSFNDNKCGNVYLANGSAFRSIYPYGLNLRTRKNFVADTTQPKVRNKLRNVSKSTINHNFLEDVVQRRNFYSLVPVSNQLKTDCRNESEVKSENVMKYQLKRVYLVDVYVSDVLENVFKHELNDVEFDTSSESDRSMMCKLMATFLVFSEEKCNVSERPSKLLRDALGVLFYNSVPLNYSTIGTPVTVISTPFKHLQLHGSHSRGIISNLIGHNDCLLMIDIKLTVGCEGSPVFLTEDKCRLLLGFVLNVFTWVKGEWTGFSLVAHLNSVIREWMNSMLLNQPTEIITGKIRSLFGEKPLLVLSKVFEKNVAKKLQPIIDEQHNLIPELQFHFCRKHSTI